MSYIFAQRVNPDIKWEVIVVDNGSTDDTALVAESCWPVSAPALMRIVREPRLGLSHARYRGIEESKYEIVSFVDDDNWLHPEWVQTVSEIMRAHPDVGACGGRNDASCEEAPPWWFAEYAKDYAVGVQAEKTGDVTITRGYLWGAGLSIRKSAWDVLRPIGFKSLLTDRRGKSLNSGGDSEICFALRLAGWRLWYDERLSLQHCIPANRLKWSYIRQLYRGFGAATVGLELYSKSEPVKASIARLRFGQTWQWKAAGALKALFKQIMNISLVDGFGEGSHQILMLEWKWGRLIEFLRQRKRYNEGVIVVGKLKYLFNK